MGFHRFCRRVVLWLAVVPCSLPSLRAQDQLATVHGRAVDRDGQPMTGCAVGAFGLDAGFDTNELLASPQAKTGADGRYQLAAKPGRYGRVVVVAAPGHQVCVQRLPSEASGECYLPDSLMLPAATLHGRVRDASGKPIVGAEVRVQDPLNANTFVPMWFESRARSDESGIFAVPGVPRTGLSVTVRAAGFASVTRLAAHDSPLDFTLAATGLVHGRVLDADGKPVPGLIVWAITAESQRDFEQVASDDEGRFTLTVPCASRFRITAYSQAPPFRQFSSRLLHGPADDVVLTAANAEPIDARRVTVRCVDAASKAPIEDFQASRNSSDSQDLAQALLDHPAERRPFHGEATFDVAPDRDNKTLGSIVVDAPGHGFAVVPIPADTTAPLIAELPVECSVSGTVIDAETGKPAVGAAVRALPHAMMQGGGPDPWQAGVVSDASGAYRIGGLRPGLYDLQVYGVGRPASRSVQVTVDAGQEAAMDMEVPLVRNLEFELLGDIPANCLGTITWSNSYTSGAEGGTMLIANLPPPPTVPLLGPRTRKIGPVGNGDFRASLHLPTRDRLGSGLTIDLGSIARAGSRLELPDLRQFVRTGHVRLPSDVPTERVAVLAQRIGDRRRGDPLASLLAERSPFAVCLGSDGSFVIDLPPGEYALQLADLETGLIFDTEAHDLVLGADDVSPPIEITPAIHWLDITLEPTVTGAPIVCGGGSIEVERPRGGQLSAMLHSNRSSNSREQGSWSCSPGITHLRWLVPEGSLRIEAWQNFQALVAGGAGVRSEPADSAEVEVAEPLHRVTLRMPPPPSDAELEHPAAK